MVKRIHAHQDMWITNLIFRILAIFQQSVIFCLCLCWKLYYKCNICSIVKYFTTTLRWIKIEFMYILSHTHTCIWYTHSSTLKHEYKFLSFVHIGNNIMSANLRLLKTGRFITWEFDLNDTCRMLGETILTSNLIFNI